MMNSDGELGVIRSSASGKPGDEATASCLDNRLHFRLTVSARTPYICTASELPSHYMRKIYESCLSGSLCEHGVKPTSQRYVHVRYTLLLM